MRTLFKASLLSLALTLGGVGHAQQPALTEIKVSYQPALYWALPFYVATENGWWAELGLKRAWRPGLHTSLALWWLALDSELVYVGDGGATEPQPASRRRGQFGRKVEGANPKRMSSLAGARLSRSMSNPVIPRSRVPDPT